MSAPDPTILQEFESAAVQSWQQGGSVGPNPSTLPTCEVKQLMGADLDSNGSCKASSKSGWCYVTGTAAGTCSQAIIFTNGAIPTGAQINLQCIETSSAVAAGTSGDGAAEHRGTGSARPGAPPEGLIQGRGSSKEDAALFSFCPRRRIRWRRDRGMSGGPRSSATSAS